VLTEALPNAANVKELTERLPELDLPPALKTLVSATLLDDLARLTQASQMTVDAMRSGLTAKDALALIVQVSMEPFIRMCMTIAALSAQDSKAKRILSATDRPQVAEVHDRFKGLDESVREDLEFGSEGILAAHRLVTARGPVPDKGFYERSASRQLRSMVGLWALPRTLEKVTEGATAVAPLAAPLAAELARLAREEFDDARHSLNLETKPALTVRAVASNEKLEADPKDAAFFKRFFR